MAQAAAVPNLPEIISSMRYMKVAFYSNVTNSYNS